MTQCGGHPDEQMAVNWFSCGGEYSGYAAHEERVFSFEF
jgi:hypothetical protein